MRIIAREIFSILYHKKPNFSIFRMDTNLYLKIHIILQKIFKDSLDIVAS